MSSQKAFRFGVSCAQGGSRRDWAEKGRRAEQLGYATLLIPDHLGEQLAPVPALLAAAAATTTLRVGSFVFDNDFRHPVMLAKEAATLDLLSDGRFELGLGAGWMRAEYDQAGLVFAPASVRVGRLAETLRIVKAFCAEEPVTFIGTHYTVTSLAGLPKPLQKPHPPLLVGGGGQRLLSIAAQEANIVSIVPRARADGGGLDLTDLTVASMAQKVAWLRTAAGDRFSTLELNTLVQAVMVTDNPHTVASQLAERYGVAPELVLETPYVLIGTVEQLCEALHARRAQYGISYVVVFEDSMDAFAPVVTRLAGQ
jgi:probable F420-dependent oxidoreductase